MFYWYFSLYDLVLSDFMQNSLSVGRSVYCLLTTWLRQLLVNILRILVSGSPNILRHAPYRTLRLYAPIHCRCGVQVFRRNLCAIAVFVLRTAFAAVVCVLPVPLLGCGATCRVQMSPPCCVYVFSALRSVAAMLYFVPPGASQALYRQSRLRVCARAAEAWA